jgi:hypothetical protein
MHILAYYANQGMYLLTLFWSLHLLRLAFAAPLAASIFAPGNSWRIYGGIRLSNFGPYEIYRRRFPLFMQLFDAANYLYNRYGYL